MRVHVTTRLVAVLTIIFFLALATPNASGKGGKHGKGPHGGDARGGFGGPGGFRGGGPIRDRIRGRLFAPRGPRWEAHRSPSGQASPEWLSQEGGSHPWAMQRAVEERKLNHRLDVADQLDQLAERTGNPQLHETAAMQRQKAQEHYEKRLAKINSMDPNYVPPEELPEGAEQFLGDSDGWDAPLTELPSQSAGVPTPAAPAGVTASPLDAFQTSTGRENALGQQLHNEQRKLSQRMDAAKRLWDAYEQTGDEALAEAARSMEEKALALFDQRLNAISNFQDRHGLTDQVGPLLHEIDEAAPAGEVSVLVNPVP